MKIAFCNRPNYNNPLGGDGIQMIKTKEALQNIYGIKIDIITDEDELSSEYDIAHIFNFLTYETTNKFIDKARKLNIKIVSSSIYWDYSFASTGIIYKLIRWYPSKITENKIKFQRSVLNFVSQILNKPKGTSKKFRLHAKKFYNAADIIAPNSKEEGLLLLNFIESKDDFNRKMRVVLNATDSDEEIRQKNSTSLYERYNIPNNYILQVGRIEYIKNQLNLVAALKNEPEIPIVFVGKVSDNVYFEKVKKIAEKRGNVFFIPSVPHDELFEFYQNARLHVLLSLRESPGLVSIEALSNGCPIVVSDKRFCPVDTYFDNTAYTTNPLNLDEIKDNVLKAYREQHIEEFDITKFSWQNTARQTYEIYSELIK